MGVSVVDNIYELVDNACTKVKHEIKCKEELGRILRWIQEHKRHLKITPNNYKDYFMQAIKNRKRLRHSVLMFSLLGVCWEICVFGGIEASHRQSFRGEFDWEDHNKRADDLQIMLDTTYMPCSMLSQIERFVEDNRSRLLDVDPKELEEFVLPIRRVIWLGDTEFGGYLGRHSAEAVLEWKLVRR